jgi:hypothetical protein
MKGVHQKNTYEWIISRQGKNGYLIEVNRRRHNTRNNDTKHNDIQHDDTEHKKLICKTEQ